MSAPIFISYSSKDQKIAETICDALQSRSLTCWISCRDIGPGENFQESIVKAIRSAKLMILVFTSNANNSDEIKKEVVLASQHRITVLPVRVEDVVPNDALAYEFATRQWIDLFKDWERQIEQLTLRVGNILSDAAVPGAAPEIAEKPPWQAPVRQSASRPALLLAGLTVVALGLGATYLYIRPATPPPSPAPPPSSVDAGRFDGLWTVKLSCPKTATALGIDAEFTARVKDAHLHAQNGIEGKPGSLTLDGNIESDGSATLNATGLSGGPAYNQKNIASGLLFSYEVAPQFDGSRGFAAVVLPLGRPCDYTFAKK